MCTAIGAMQILRLGILLEYILTVEEENVVGVWVEYGAQRGGGHESGLSSSLKRSVCRNKEL